VRVTARIGMLPLLNSLMNEKVVAVTGASGFIGEHLSRALLDQAAEVHTLSRSEPKLSGARLWWHKVDLTELEATRKVMSSIRPDIVFHLCSYPQGERDLALVLPTFRGELQAAVNVLTTVTEIRIERLIMIRSLEEPSPGEIPSSPYAAAKAASRSYALMFHQLYGLPVVMLRIFMAYGPGQSMKKIIPHFIGCMLRGEPLKIVSPDRKVDWIYVDDVIRALLTAAITPGLEGKSVDIGSGELMQICDVAERIQRLTKSRSVLELGKLPARALEQVRYADTETARTLMGWYPAISFDAGLAKTVDHYTRNYSRENGSQNHLLEAATPHLRS
jgi:UDP-glucose 4-epimerase